MTGLVQAKAALAYLVPAADHTPPQISNLAASPVNAKRGTFKITWTTDEPATSVAAVQGLPTQSDPKLVTSHSMTFTGTKGATYSYSVSSKDAAGNSKTLSGFTHQN